MCQGLTRATSHPELRPGPDLKPWMFHASSRLFWHICFLKPLLLLLSVSFLRSTSCWRRVEDAKGTRSVAAMGSEQSDSEVELAKQTSLWISLDNSFFLASSSHIFSYLLMYPFISTELSLEHLGHEAPKLQGFLPTPYLVCRVQAKEATT